MTSAVEPQGMALATQRKHPNKCQKLVIYDSNYQSRLYILILILHIKQLRFIQK